MKRPSWPAASANAKPYFDEAKRRNSEWHEKRRSAPTPFWGIAKPVLVFDDAYQEPQWRLRSEKQFWSETPVVSFDVIKPDGRCIPTGRPAEHHVNAMVEAPERTAQDNALRDVVTALVEAYERRPDAVHRRQILHTLHRLQLYAGSVTMHAEPGAKTAALAVRQAVGAQPGSAPRALLRTADLESYIAFFEDVRQHLAADNGTVTAEDTAEIMAYLKSITRYFRDLSLSFAEITDKLATKPATFSGASAKLRERLIHLVDEGLQRVDADVSQASMQSFLSAFTRASRCFLSMDPRSGADDLDQLIDKTVTRLLGLRRTSGAPLFDLLEHLTRSVLELQDTHLIATFEALLRNPQFQAYAENLSEASKTCTLNATVNRLIRDPRAALWRAGAALLVRRPPDEFSESLHELVVTSAPGSIAHTKLNYIFSRLNLALDQPADALQHKQAKERYRSFLAHLADSNSLHALTMVAATSDEKALTAANLQMLYNFNAQDLALLNPFFSNAGFKAGELLEFNGSPMLRDIEAMLRQSRAHPVEDGDGFAAQIDTLAEDFALGLPTLRGLVLRSLGERSTPGLRAAEAGGFPRLGAVEDWLREKVFPDYYKVMRTVISCYPLAWEKENFALPHLLADKLIMSATGQLLIAGFDSDRFVLGDILGLDGGYDPTPPDPTQTYHAACDVHTLFEKGEGLVQHNEIQRSIKLLTHSYHDFRSLSLDTTKIEPMRKLLSRLQTRLQLESSAEQTPDELRLFQAHLDAVMAFLRSVSSFSQSHLDAEAKRRFFRNGVMTDHGRKFLFGHEHAGATEPSVLQTAIADRLFDIVHDAVKQVVESSDSASLCKALQGLDPEVQRNIDFRSFNTELMVDAFNKRHQVAEAKRSAFQLDHDATEALRQKIYDESKAALKKRNIEYIMPNQALAAYLCRHPDLQDENILLKMGTGQGKSIVIAATALGEAERLGVGEFVFVLTGYDHLAQRDHETGRDFFAPRNVESACISTLADLDALPSHAKVIYADTKSLQQVAQQAVAYQLASLSNPEKFPPKPGHLDFLNRLYTGKHRFVLDEYDLVLNDLDFSRGGVQAFGAAAIDAQFVTKNAAYSPYLAGLKKAEVPNLGTSRDKADGINYSTLSTAYALDQKGQPVYFLRTGALRVSQLLAGASRIIGLSGSAEGDTLGSVLGLGHLSAKYFELPSSRDPDAFATRIVQAKEDLNGVPGVWCAKTASFPAGAQADYIAAVVSDVQAARKARPASGGGRSDAGQVERPVLIFVNPDQPDLVEDLYKALGEVVPKEHLHEKLDLKDIEGGRLQEIGLGGSVTLTSLVCGRGADIYVSPDVPDTMHVVLATQVPSDRIKTQIIGRTGRMGRDGSYSQITLDKASGTASNIDQRATENMLHEMTLDIVQHMVKGCGRDFALRWLMLASELVWGSKATVDARRAEFRAQP